MFPITSICVFSCPNSALPAFVFFSYVPNSALPAFVFFSYVPNSALPAFVSVANIFQIVHYQHLCL